jgi:hypothetical protein
MGIGIKTYSVTVLGFVATFCAGVAAAAPQSHSRDGVIVVAPVRPSEKRSAQARQDSVPARALLADSLGQAVATGPLDSPDPELAPFAGRITARDAAARRYGDLGVTVYRGAHEAMSSAIARLSKPEGAASSTLAAIAAFADGGGGWVYEGETVFWRGPYAAIVTGGTAESRASLVEALVARMSPVSAPAPLLEHLPETGQVAGSRGYAPTYENLRRFRPDLVEDTFQLETGGAEATVADYEQAGGAPFRLTVVEYQTPQLAAAAERSLRARYDALPAEQKAGSVYRREGNYLVEATGVRDMAAAQTVVGAVDYAYKVDWLKEPPIRPNFDVAGEGHKVAQVIVSSFGIVGLGLAVALSAGIVVGAEMFRRRRRAAGNLFSDAGGMVCLDLDPALPPTAVPAGLLTERAGGDD